MSTSSPSPSLPRALWSLVAFIFFPILSLIWIRNCRNAQRSEWLVFLMFYLIGLGEIIFLAGGWSGAGIPYPVGIAAYIVTLFAQLFFLAIIKDEIEKRKPSQA